MKKTIILILSLGFAAALFTACAPQSVVTEVPAPESITVQEAGTTASSQESTLTVNATETVKVMPDIAYLNLGVQTTGTDAQAAQQSNAEISNAVLSAIKAQGVVEKDIETAYVNIYPDYNDPNQTFMENVFKVTVRDISKVGSVLDAAVAAGSNQSYSISFDVEDRDSVYIQALSQAMEAVGVKAKAVAASGGFIIVRPQSITENNYGYSVPNALKETAAMDSGTGQATPVNPQEIEISATVSGVYVIE